MKRLKYNINNILWLCKPYWKYDRAYFILYILTSFAFFPFGDIIMHTKRLLVFGYARTSIAKYMNNAAKRDMIMSIPRITMINFHGQ